MEDGSSIKKTEEDEREDRELAEKVNATLAEEKRKENEEKKREEEEDEKKNRDKKTEMTDKVKDQDGMKEDTKKQVGQGEDCPSCNYTCPEVESCHPCRECPEIVECDPCQECPPIKECGPCSKVKLCKPCPVANCSSMDIPTVQLLPCTCPEEGSMSVPVALAVGAIASLLATGAAAAIGLLLRYASPIESGFVFVATIVIIWYLSSHYPETARELSGRAANLLREAAVALGHRLMAAVQRHQEQVSVPIKLNLFLLNEFHVYLKSLH
jgi:hypothetical protein